MHLKNEFFKERTWLSIGLLAIVYFECFACVILKPANSQSSYLKQRHNKTEHKKSKYFFYSQISSSSSSPLSLSSSSSSSSFVADQSPTSASTTTSSSYLEELVIKSVLIDKQNKLMSQETTSSSPLVFDLKNEVKRDSDDYNDITEEPVKELDFDKSNKQEAVSSNSGSKRAVERKHNKPKSKQRTVSHEVRGECRLRPVEVTLHLENCGYFTVNTTVCAGLCKSEEHVVANTNLKRRSCSTCRPTRFSIAKYNVYCKRTKEFKVYEMKAISSCKCFKYSVDSKVEMSATIMPSSAFQDTDI